MDKFYCIIEEKQYDEFVLQSTFGSKSERYNKKEAEKIIVEFQECKPDSHFFLMEAIGEVLVRKDETGKDIYILEYAKEKE